MIQIIINLPSTLQTELAIHACACDLTITQLIKQCVTGLVESGRPAGWEDLSASEESECLSACARSHAND